MPSQESGGLQPEKRSSAAPSHPAPEGDPAAPGSPPDRLRRRSSAKPAEESFSELVYRENSSDNETEVSYMIDFYDKIHFNRVLAKKMANFLNRKSK